jgi:DHA2 family multidrug resistance protein
MWKCDQYLGIGIFRLMQGIGGGALLVTSQTIITESYPIEKRSMAQAIYGLGVIIGPTLSAIGGYIVDNLVGHLFFILIFQLGL